MAMTDWMIEADSFGGCNCDQACPCQFEGLPNYGECKGFEVFRITRGHFGATDLTGCMGSVLYAWPGPIFEGKGQMQVIIGETASAEQHTALATILHGGETEEAANHWWVFAAMTDIHHPVQTAAIWMDLDIEARRARAGVAGLVEAEGRPIISPATGAEHRIRIDIPAGIEFTIAEIGAASARVGGPFPFELRGSYGQFNRLRQSGRGIVR
jgi:hypothetical protein